MRSGKSLSLAPDPSDQVPNDPPQRHSSYVAADSQDALITAVNDPSRFDDQGRAEHALSCFIYYVLQPHVTTTPNKYPTFRGEPSRDSSQAEGSDSRENSGDRGRDKSLIMDVVSEISLAIE